MDTSTGFIQTLTEDTDLLSVAFDAIEKGVLICDYQNPDLPIIYCNKPFEKFTGYTFNEIKGKNPRFMQADSTSIQSREVIRNCLNKGTSCTVEIINQKKDGAVFWLELKLFPIKNGLGVIAYYVGIQNDISERKMQEVNAQFNAIQSAKLQEIKEDFINIASHELKTPLTSLAASIQILERIQRDEIPETAKMLIRQSERSVSKMQDVVNDLMLFTKIKENGLSVNKSNFPLSEIISSCCSAVKSAGKHKLVMKGDHESVVFADRQLIDHIITCLINNAAKHGGECDLIEINIIRDGDMAKVEIIDNGPGIHEKLLPYIFDRYYRSGMSGVQHSGIGVGLYICSEIVKLHQGKMGVLSTQGEGSTFWFTVPLFKANSTGSVS